MSNRPPDIIDPLEFAEKGRVVEGSLPLMELDRLRDQLLQPSGDVRFHLRFLREGSVLGARCRIETELSLQCQSCLGPLTYGVASEVAVGFVGSIDQANLLPESFEPVLLDDPHVLRIAELVEDEVLLAIPHVPRHDACEAVDQVREADTMTDRTAMRRPFADLGHLFPSDTKRN